METTYDVLVIGGGPGGSTAALCLAREGLRVALVDRLSFPHFHIGESLLPRNFELLQALGLEGKLAALPHVPKYGAEFVMGHGQGGGSIRFADGLVPGRDHAVNLERAPFDAMLLKTAREAGVEVIEGAAVRSFPSLSDGDVRAVLDNGREMSARFLIDASGQSTVVGKHLGLRKMLPDLKKAAYFGHFVGALRPPGEAGGYIRIVMCVEGWFWLIPLDETRTSIGLVMDAELARGVGLPANRMLAWGIARCPLVAEVVANAVAPDKNEVLADFSYRCAPYAGPGYFLVGDAATFVDPIFSTGVCLAMMSAVEASQGIAAILQGASPSRVRKDYIRFIEGSTSAFFGLVRMFYRPYFRELLLEAQGPLAVHRAIISLLAGEVFPRPAFGVRWRIGFMRLMAWMQRRIPIAPRKERWSLLAAEVPAPAAESAGKRPAAATG